MSYVWKRDTVGLDWHALSELYRIAPLGEKSVDFLQTVFGNSRYVALVFEGERLVAAGRALADGADCAYLCDVAVAPDKQGCGLGREVIRSLMSDCAGHRKIILYAVPGKEGFYRSLGFRRMATAMAVFENQEAATARGLLQSQ
ncbi:GNAT family N-acetyltransferase [uncultured Aquitalea sp.]|uniref:GNAT family N-acetyltransferase n=1 Tax=uncultured Aquitalea sp. TaxID=540272 RepID=UPI0025E199C4|nr:GNAT family N-acetyltransferase [uncultured Aquitalea sp.]